MDRPDTCFTGNEVALMNQLRRLWEEHIMWTRSFIISAVSELGDLDAVTARLLRNPDDFGNLLSLFYGVEIGDEFKTLLSDHLLIAADLVNAAKMGNTEAADSTRAKWYDNADDIAMFLSEINPNWNLMVWQSLLYEHLEMVENEAVTRLNEDYEQNVMSFDQMQTQALQMADYMFEGLAKQFDLD